LIPPSANRKGESERLVAVAYPYRETTETALWGGVNRAHLPRSGGRMAVGGGRGGAGGARAEYGVDNLDRLRDALEARQGA